MEELQTSDNVDQQEAVHPQSETISHTNVKRKHLVFAVAIMSAVLVTALIINALMVWSIGNVYFPEPVDADYKLVTMTEFDATISVFPYQASPERVKQINRLRLHAESGMKIDPDRYTLFLDEGTPPIMKGVIDEPIVPDVVQQRCPMSAKDQCYGWGFTYYVYKNEAGIVNEKHDVWLSIYTSDTGEIQNTVWQEDTEQKLLLDPGEFSHFQHLEIGMTKNEVLTWVDEEESYRTETYCSSPLSEVWRYKWDVRGQHAWAEIHFLNGKVIALLGNVQIVQEDMREATGCFDSTDAVTDTVDVGIPSMTDDLTIREIFEQYLSGGTKCDIDGAYGLISEQSKEIVRFTCQNYQAETKCYENRDMAVRVTGDTGVIYRVPFSHQVENPVFFVREDGEWKIAFSKMAFGMAMAGSTCDSGWSWINETLPAEFCGYFPEGECPDK